MASRSKRRSKKGAARSPLDGVKRYLDRGDFKQALKDVRVCYRGSATPECRCFLEHAYIGRAQQLLQNGLIEDSRRIVRDLLDLGVTEPAVEAGLPDLLLSLGLFDCLPQGDDALAAEEWERLRVKAADQAVVQPENLPKSMPELRDDAQRIRAALEAVEREEETAALGHLKDIPRQSLFADWKYFVRGLIAYYGRDKGGLAANWDRLDPDRAAARIATVLKAMAGLVSPQQDSGLRLKIGRLEKQATSQTALSQVMRLRQAASDHDWPKVFGTLRAVRGELRTLDADVYRRLVSCLCGTLVGDGLVDELQQLSRIADPLPIDPRWNRAQAVACEVSEDYDLEDAEEYWREYLRDLEDLPAFSPSQRDLARGMIWLHLAGFYVNDADHLRGCRCRIDHGPDIEEAEEEARNAFRHCLSLAPTYAPGYEALAEFHVTADQPEEAAGIYRRLLEHVPDNLEALLFLGKHYVTHGDPRKACEYAERARECKPLDAQIGQLLQTARVEAARDLARSQQYDQARDELAAADRVAPARACTYDVLARRAVLEIKAGDTAAARRFIEQAQDQLGEPTALWLTMAIEAIRFDLPKQEGWLYEKRWRDALKRRCRSETAGLMCQTLATHLKTLQPYPGHQEHVPCLLKYLRRCSRVKWQLEDLREVCEFLMGVEELALAAKFAKRGVRNWPRVAYFHALLGLQESAKGPVRCNRAVAADHLQVAVELASESNDPRDVQVVEQSKRLLDALWGPQDDFAVDDEDDYEDEDDEGMDGFSPEDLYDVIRRTCGRMGVDPEAILDELAPDQQTPSPRTRRKK